VAPVPVQPTASSCSSQGRPFLDKRQFTPAAVHAVRPGVAEGEAAPLRIPGGWPDKLVKVDGTGVLDLGTGGEPDTSSDGTQGTDYIALAVMRADGSNPVEIWHTVPKTNNFNVGAAWGTAP
jgi:hypothetical protein